MDAFWWVLLAIGFVFWIIWQWGKSVGLDEGKHQSDRKERIASAEHAREIERLERKSKDLMLELRAVETVLQQAKSDRDALAGETPFLLGLWESRPSWVTYPHPFVLLGPGRLRELGLWAIGAQTVWQDVDRLSAQSRRALEEAYIAERDGASSDDATQLLRQVGHVMREKPSELDVNLFDLKGRTNRRAGSLV